MEKFEIGHILSQNISGGLEWKLRVNTIASLTTGEVESLISSLELSKNFLTEKNKELNERYKII